MSIAKVLGMLYEAHIQPFITIEGLMVFKDEQDRENEEKFLSSADFSNKADLSDVPIMIDADGNIVLRK